ncbi:MAG: AbrB/MazE/SpoVT family DNA-binding domain-containing protein [Candidatus Bipolaricaulota bacterium]|nr:AbrB/MazE/SpoVT family DNA-binding domain-containing protein [Candidatus Bipolaricaulota bacterium]MDW8140683.1 AbrB/MazE/SpoVT family DNA-binding domain-containing protein [Candidatus Bipolaricaulota bacterium]
MISSKVTSKGQMTIPKEIRDYLGLHSGDRVVFIRRNGEVVLQGLKGTLLHLRGSVKARRQPEDFNDVRERTKRQVARKAAHE